MNGKILLTLFSHTKESWEKNVSNVIGWLVYNLLKHFLIKNKFL